MHEDFPTLIRQATGARAVRPIETIQELWSGYGAILRYGLTGSERERVVVKHVRFPDRIRHPRGWNTDRSHRRKLRSYEVERTWYARWSARCGGACRIPHCLALETRGDEALMVLEDLDEAGFPQRREAVSEAELLACLGWLANFHATFLGCDPDGLWEQGTYWHLETRPDELEALADLPLKRAASAIDRMLRESPYQTIVHGDAKLENFCFSPDGGEVAAVDFQYVGGGCGMKDLAYYIGSCLDEEACERLEPWLLESYFASLRKALARLQPSIDAGELEKDWRALYPVAWTDFHRFLKGWSPGHWKLTDYSERMARAVVRRLEQEGEV
ncbi:MAG: choline kinase [Desulfuromonas sp.]|uniref:phosphotransferase n=1 Tax=Desulfuromonas sp. TaxID=892 RepID=UPI000CBEF0E4|nr:phosphotransferase [Desulfuromonas sp.]PLX86315.1 MAG: choline kinase [Desulfuromonas sp.]